VHRAARGALVIAALRRRLARVRTGPVETLRRLRWTRVIEQEKDARLSEKLRWWPRGFRVQSARLYGFPAADPGEYVPDYIVGYRYGEFNPAEAFFDHKAARRAMLLAMGAPQVETVALLWRGRVVLQPFTPAHRAVTLEELDRWLVGDGGEFVVKPEGEGRGQRVTLVRSEGGRLVRQYGTSRGPHDLSECYGRFTIIERRAEQAPFWRDLFPDTLNTLRLLTIWPEGARLPFVARAIQKIGTADSVPADNFARGGLAAPVDLETGRMEAARAKHDVTVSIARHPETGALIEGVTLPGWQELLDDVVRIAAGFPGDCFVGWDVFRDAAERTVIVEANGGTTGVQILQIGGGLLRDPRVRAFYQAIDVL
jgi:hypothetical protein